MLSWVQYLANVKVSGLPSLQSLYTYIINPCVTNFWEKWRRANTKCTFDLLLTKFNSKQRTKTLTSGNGRFYDWGKAGNLWMSHTETFPQMVSKMTFLESSMKAIWLSLKALRKKYFKKHWKQLVIAFRNYMTNGLTGVGARDGYKKTPPPRPRK